MSTTIQSQEGKLYFLSLNGNDQYYLNRLSSPPLAWVNEDVIYSLGEGILYYNGNPIMTGTPATNLVTTESANQGNHITIWNGTGTKDVMNSQAQVFSDGTIQMNGVDLIANSTSPQPAIPTLIWLNASNYLKFNNLTLSGLRTPCQGSMQYEDLSGPGTTFTAAASIPFPIIIPSVFIASSVYFQSGGTGLLQYTGQTARVTINVNIVCTIAFGTASPFEFYIVKNGITQAYTTAGAILTKVGLQNIVWISCLDIQAGDTLGVVGNNVGYADNFLCRGLTMSVSSVNI